PFSHNSGIHRPRRLRRDGTRIPEIRNSLPAAGPLCGSCPPSPPLAVWSTLPVAASLVVLRLPPYTLPSSKEIIAENLFLRRQLALYQERKARRRRSTPAVKFTLVLLSRFFPWERTLAIVKPSTLVRWHRAGFSTVRAM